MAAQPDDRAAASTSPARHAAEAYQTHISAGDADALIALFAPDAVVLHPAGEFRGPDAIRGFYETNVLPFGVVMDAVSWVSDHRTCVFEIEAHAASGGPAMYAIDHLTVDDDGRIARLAIYYRR
ncbi:MAG TPA: nuclear transport factor 2 family protein [Acidimicrobiales bacterium]